jgi:L-fuculokinase
VPCARFMGGREFATLAGENPPEPGRQDVAELVDAGVYALPSFSDQGGPFATRKGRLEGPAPESPRARAALATLYAALMTAHLIDRLEARGEIVVEGGFARHGAFAGALAALLPRRRVVVAASASGAAEGAARIARWSEPADPPRVASAPVWAIPGLDAYRARWSARLREP